MATVAVTGGTGKLGGRRRWRRAPRLHLLLRGRPDRDLHAGPRPLGTEQHIKASGMAYTSLQSPHDHAGATYDLTGPQALTLGQVADILTRVTGRPPRPASTNTARFKASIWLTG
jgi:hypothetical protein